MTRLNAADENSRCETTAKLIGVDLQEEAHFHWIVDLAAHCSLPPEWKAFAEESTGQVAYYHPRLKLLQKIHPMLARFKHLVDKQREFIEKNERPTGQMAEEKMLGQISILLGESMNRAHRELPPATPEIVESLCILLNINSVADYHLAGVVKHSLDEREQVTDRRRDLRKVWYDKQIRREVTDKHEDVVICQECEELAATLKCDPCKDFFCRGCFEQTHATGKRKKHLTVELDQQICGACRRKVADSVVASGTPTEQYFCDECYSKAIKETPDLRKLPKKIIKGLKCFECELSDRQRVARGSTQDTSREATIICEECWDLFCPECFIELHGKGRRASHVQLTIDDKGEMWRGGVKRKLNESSTRRENLQKEVLGWLSKMTNRIRIGEIPPVGFEPGTFRLPQYDMRLTICLFIIISTIALDAPIDPVDGREAAGALRPNSLAIPNPIRVERPDDGNSSAANDKDAPGGARGGKEAPMSISS
ncbi:hypothetical protein FOZ61_010265 [Perkinsus olseni]|uniref:B box-type domain-containing protein n=1 Tax=Perkinsus olseni TaxID=32597 RepID=A0A7J6KXP3_PEROL|nr:hypothetical protein FOZ61_010265 [Perkinsus olseni]